MNEVEVKVIEIDKHKVIKQLELLGAQKIGEGEQHTIIFDYPDNSLENQKAFLRLRKKHGKVFITFKKHLSSKTARTSDEIEVEVENFDQTALLFNALGFKVMGNFKSKRTTYNLGKTIFEIDEYEGIPTYMEIESEDEETINKFIKKLGFEEDKVRNWGGRQLFAHYGKKFY